MQKSYMHFSGNNACVVCFFFFNLHPCLQWEKARCFCTQNSEFLVPGWCMAWWWRWWLWIRFLVGRTMKRGGGSALVRLRFLKDDFMTSPAPRPAERTSHVYTLCRPYATDSFLWNSQNFSLVRWRCVSNTFYQYQYFMLRAKNRYLLKQCL